MSGPVVGSTFAGCELEGVAGRGGMGVVYRARQPALERLVAVKVISPQLAEDPGYRERFVRESRLAACIEHPHVLPVYDAGELDGSLYLISRWVQGSDLRALLASEGRLSPERAVALHLPVAGALGAAHRRGLVHRDLKPANVLIAHDEQSGAEHVYLSDFGIARRTAGEEPLTRTGMVVGSPGYMAPERIEGSPGDRASDIYAFGCVLFEALTGHVPFERATELEKIEAHLHDPVPSARAEAPDVPERLDAVVARAMAKDPAERFSSADELATALASALETPKAAAALEAPAPGPGLEFRLLGPFEVRRDGVAVDLGARRQRALLALLLLRANEVVAAERLVDELWGERPPKSAHNIVQTYVSRLRKALGEGVLVTEQPGYVLAVEQGQVDALRFQALMARARGALESGDPGMARESLAEAIGLWRGPPLSEFTYETFAQAEVSRLQELRLEALELRIDADLALGRHVRLVGELEQLVALDPFRERLRAQQMLALYRCGRQAEALDAYRAARQALVEQLGIEPSPQLKRLEQQILDQDPALDPTLVERQLTRPAATKEPNHNLPAELTSLIGRESETETIASLLDQHRLVTIAGPGGVGKTRVAQRAAGNLLQRFADGVWFVDLAALDKAGDVAAAVLSALQVPDRPGRAALDTLAEQLHERDTMIVLDNCEHVLSAAAAVSARLLSDCPRLHLLSTSREPLGVPGERVERLEPLATTVDGPGQAPAVELFLDRAATHGVTWQHDREALQTIAEICQRLDGIPLAIELAAARTRAISPQQLLAHLDDRLRLLARPSHWAAQARQQTLEATIAWSYRLLTEPEQATLRRLAVFQGGFTLPAAVAVCADIATELDTLERLTALVDRSVVTIQHRHDADRYRLLESIGLFAAQRLEHEQEQAETRDRHARYYAQLGREAAAQLHGPAQAARARQLDAEEENLIAALSWCLERTGDPILGAQLAVSVSRHWMQRGRTSIDAHWLGRARLSGAELPPEVAAAVHSALSDLALQIGDLDKNRTSALEAVRLARQTPDMDLLAETLADLARAHLNCGEAEAATAAAAEVRALQPSLSSPEAQTATLVPIGLVALAAGDTARAQQDIARARELATRVGDHRRAAISGYWLTYALALLGDLPEARQAIDQAAKDAARSGYQDAIAQATVGRAALALLDDDRGTASRLLPEAADRLQALQQFADLGDVLCMYALLELKRGRPQRSALFLGAAEHCGTWESESKMLFPDIDRMPERLAAALGAEQFAHARGQGAALKPDEILRLLHDEPTG